MGLEGSCHDFFFAWADAWGDEYGALAGEGEELGTCCLDFVVGEGTGALDVDFMMLTGVLPMVMPVCLVNSSGELCLIQSLRGLSARYANHRWSCPAPWRMRSL